MADGAESELQAAAGVSGHGIPLELWDVPIERRDGEGERAKHARSLRRPEQPESISIRFARPCLPIPLRRAWGSKCRV